MIYKIYIFRSTKLIRIDVIVAWSIDVRKGTSLFRFYSFAIDLVTSTSCERFYVYSFARGNILSFQTVCARFEYVYYILLIREIINTMYISHFLLIKKETHAMLSPSSQPANLHYLTKAFPSAHHHTLSSAFHI